MSRERYRRLTARGLPLGYPLHRPQRYPRSAGELGERYLRPLTPDPQRRPAHEPRALARMPGHPTSSTGACASASRAERPRPSPLERSTACAGPSAPSRPVPFPKPPTRQPPGRSPAHPSGPVEPPRAPSPRPDTRTDAALRAIGRRSGTEAARHWGRCRSRSRIPRTQRPGSQSWGHRSMIS